MHSLREWLPPSPPERPWILRNREILAWNADAPAEVDVHEFESLLRRARLGGTDAADGSARHCLERAVALFRSDLAPSIEADWLIPVRQRLHRQHEQGLEQLWQLQLQDGDLEAARATAEALVAIAPDRESAYRALMVFCSQSGDRSGALEWFRRLARHLTDRLGIDPSPGIQALAAAIERGETPDATWATDLGGSRTAIVEPKEPVGGNVPPAYDRFVGREPQLEELSRLLTITRALTLTGAGGSGKTRLAHELALREGGRFAHGVWWLTLEAVSDPAYIGQSLAQIFGLRPSGDQSVLTAVIRHLAERQMLLVLDNCEHLAAAAAGMAQTLIEACPQLRILATSRVKLNYLGEYAWAVPPLTVPSRNGHAPKTAALDSEAVRLFLTRVEANWPHYAVTDTRLDAIAGLCQQLEGIPLAIELAAARAGVLEVEDIAVRLALSLKALRSHDRTHPDRHRTLTATIDWGYDLLSPSERRILRRLAVFAGGFSLRAATSVCAFQSEGIEMLPDADEVADIIARLVDKSFIVILATAESRRFRLLEIIRQYGHAQLSAADELDACERRHAQFFLDLTDQAGPHLNAPSAESWMQYLDAEQFDIRKAADWMQNHEAWSWAAQLGSSIWRYWYVRGMVEYARPWMERVLLHLQGKLDATGEANFRYGLGALAYAQSDLDSARRQFRLSLDRFAESSDQTMLASVYLNLGTIALTQGEFDEAKAQLNNFLELSRPIGNTATVLYATSILAETARRQGDLTSAQSLAESLTRQADQLPGTSATYAGMRVAAMVSLNQGAFQIALGHAERWLELSQNQKDKRETASALNTKGMVLMDLGHFAESAACLKLATEHFQELGNEQEVAQVLHNLGELDLRQGEYAVSRLYLTRSLRIKDARSDNWNRIYTLLALADLDLLQDAPDDADRRSAEALALARQFGALGLQTQALRVRASLALHQGEFRHTARDLADSLSLADTVGQQRALAQDLDLAAALAVEMGDHLAASRFSGFAEAVRESIAAPRTFGEGEVYRRLTAATEAALGEAEARGSRAAAQQAGRGEAVAETLAWLRAHQDVEVETDTDTTGQPGKTL